MSFFTCDVCDQKFHNIFGVTLDSARVCLDCAKMCDNCGLHTHPDSAVEHDGACLCDSCLDDVYPRCADCDERHDVGATQDVGGEFYCDDCFDERFTRCDDCGAIVDSGDAMCGPDGSAYCPDCYDDLFCECAECGETIARENGYSPECAPYRNMYCDSCYCDLFVCCDDCGNDAYREDASCDDESDCWYCEHCYHDHHHTEWSIPDFRPSQVHTEIKSTRRFGIEFETSSCPNHSELRGDIAFGCVSDGSITGMEFRSAILSSDKGLDAVRAFCRLANHYNFEIDSRCGIHVHVDLSRESIANIKSVAYAFKLTERLWRSFVSEHRRANRYCDTIRWDYDNLEKVTTRDEMVAFCWGLDRYTWANIAAWRKHGTIEIRLHSASLNADKATNWIKALCRFVDCVALKTRSELDRMFSGSLQSQFNALAAILVDTELAEYLAERATRFGADIAAPVAS